MWWYPPLKLVVGHGERGGMGGGESCNIKEKDFNNELSLNGSKYINQIDHVCHVFQVFCVVSCCFVLFRLC